MSPPPLHISHTEILVRLSPFFPISFSYLSFLYPILLQTFSLLASLSLSPSISLSLSFSISVSIYLSLSQSLSIPFSLSVPASLCLLLSLPPSPISFSDSLYNSLSLFISLSLPVCQYLPLSLSLSLSLFLNLSLHPSSFFACTHNRKRISSRESSYYPCGRYCPDHPRHQNKSTLFLIPSNFLFLSATRIGFHC